MEPRLHVEPRVPGVRAGKLGDPATEAVERFVLARAAADHRWFPPGERGCDAPRSAEGQPRRKAERTEQGSEPGLSLVATTAGPLPGCRVNSPRQEGARVPVQL